MRVRFDLGAPPPNVAATIEFDGGEEVVLAAIDPDSGHQRSGLEAMFPLPAADRGPRQLVNDPRL